MLDYVQKKKLRVISTNALQEACKIAIKLKHNILVSYKSKSQPVTNADKQIDLYLRSFFKSKTPNIGWLSEESIDDHSRFNKKLFWCLDPIDGTRSYINKKPEYTISLALIENNIPIMGHIVNPETTEYFYGEKNYGAYCNDQKIKVSQFSELNKCKIAISNSETTKLESLKIFKKKKIKKLGSIAYKVALVAKGEIDVALSFTKKNDWDLAAADLIINEAGGEVKDINGNNIIYNTTTKKIHSVLAGNKSIVNELKNLFNK